MTEWLNGKKTYLSAAGLIVLGIALFCGVELTPEQMAGIGAILSGAMGAALKSAAKKAEPVAETEGEAPSP